jgi:hypothetical protein
MIHTHSWKRSNRSGAAFLLFVVMVVLVVVGATQTMVRSEWTARRGEAGRMRVRSMAAAIDAVVQDSVVAAEPIVLPVDESRNESIEISMDHQHGYIIARWMKGDQVIDQMRQVVNAIAESKE